MKLSDVYLFKKLKDSGKNNMYTFFVFIFFIIIFSIIIAYVSQISKKKIDYEKHDRS